MDASIEVWMQMVLSNTNTVVYNANTQQRNRAP